MSKPYETVSQIMAERDQLRAELAALKAGQGVAVATICMGCVDLSSHVRELEHKMDYYKNQAASPAPADAVLVQRELLKRLCGATQQSVVPDLATLRTLYVQRMKATDELRALLAQSESKG